MTSVTVTLVRKEGGACTKRIALGPDGQPVGDASGCAMARGEAERVALGADPASALAALIGRMEPHEALILGDLADGLPARIRIDLAARTGTKEAKARNVHSRTRGNFLYRAGRPAFVLLDHDPEGMPPAVRELLRSLGGFRGALAVLLPGSADAAHVVRASTSAGLSNAATGERYPGAGGEHLYLLIRDGGDAERFLRVLHDRAWLSGLGWHRVGRAGQLLERSLVDRMVHAPERLCFEGGPVLAEPLRQDRAARRPVAQDGPAFDSVAACPSLSPLEQEKLAALKRADARALQDEALKARAEYLETQSAQLAAERGLHVATARRVVEGRCRGELFGSDLLVFDDPDLGAVTVAAVLADPARFDDRTLADPLQGPDHGRNKAKVFVQPDGTVLIHSFAHGGGIYRLRHDAASLAPEIERAGRAAVDLLAARVAAAALSEDEIEALTRLAADTAKVGVRAVAQRLKAERKRAAQEAARRREREIRAEVEAGGRLARARPGDSDELTPTVAFLDEALAASSAGEPVMRGLDGWPRRVVHQASAVLHLLEPEPEDEPAGPRERKPAPPAPLIGRHTVASMTMRIEQDVVFLKQTAAGPRPARLQPTFVNALMELPATASRLPVLKAIVSTPLVAPDGRIIAMRGFDPGSGIFFDLSPAELAAVPTGEITDGAIRAAYQLLVEEMLCDVATDADGLASAIAYMGTLSEAPLLPERPAFMVQAPQRGGGKTTLLHMCSHVVFNRPAAATAWSDSKEERRKAIFAGALEGQRSQVFDNIPRGTAITCPEIEKLLTAEEITDRVLGETRTGTASARVTIAFTGNNIQPAGDMASRTLLIRIDPGRPDPENRAFRHADPIAWVQANRGRLLGALLTILAGNPMLRRRREAGFQPETRFKLWWTLIGSAVEHAAGLYGHEVSFQAMFARNEVHDEEAAGRSELVAILKERFGARAFTAREVAALINPPDPAEGIGAELSRDKDTSDGAALLEALVKATGGRGLRQVTGHAVGLRFRSLRKTPVEIDGQVLCLDLQADKSGDEARLWHVTEARSARPAAPAAPGWEATI
jgi:hypothetical protein